MQNYELDNTNKIEKLKLLKNAIKSDIFILVFNISSIITTSSMTYSIWKTDKENFILVFYIGSVVFMAFCFDIYYENLKENIDKIKKLKMNNSFEDIKFF